MTVLLIPIVALLIPMIIVPTALGFKHARFLREMDHAERMKALEMGRPVPRDGAWTSADVAREQAERMIGLETARALSQDGSSALAGVAASIGALVPIASMLIAWLATRSYNVVDAPIETIWKSAAWVGVSGVIGGTILAYQQIQKRDRIAPASEEKLAYDPDTFDVVGSRG